MAELRLPNPPTRVRFFHGPPNYSDTRLTYTITYIIKRPYMTRVRYFIMGRPTGDVFQWHDTNDGKAGGTASSVSVCEGERLTALLR